MMGDLNVNVRLNSHSHNNLRDFLRIRDEDHHQQQQTADSEGSQRRRRRSICSAGGITLPAMLAETRGGGGGSSPSPPPPRRPSVDSSSTPTLTLLDIIRQDPIPNVGCRRSWRQLRDRIRLRHAFAVRRSNSHSTSNMDPAEPSSSYTSSSFREEERGGRTSLMALLENDWQFRSSANTLRQEMEEEEEQEEEERASVNAAATWVEEEDGEEVVYKNENEYPNNNRNSNSCCCVCMVRHKGAAFIPCGHTFCRVCSRQVWLHRGQCPLCNNTILEILHIF